MAAIGRRDKPGSSRHVRRTTIFGIAADDPVMTTGLSHVGMSPPLAALCLWWAVLAGVVVDAPARGSETPCAITVVGQRVVLESPALAFTLDTADGLRAVSWENRLTGRKLILGNGPEVELDIGLPKQPRTAPKFRVAKLPASARGDSLAATFELVADDPPAAVTVTYRWDTRQPVLRKFVTITNCGASEWNRLLHVQLGNYRTDARGETPDPGYPVQLTRTHLSTERAEVADPAGRERGFPAYIEWQFFASLAHPAGVATRRDGELSLRQLPGVKLAPGATFACMEAVYGVSRVGEARGAFRDYLHSRMRRVLRRHDKPLAIFEPFGGKPDGDFWQTEEYLLDNLAKVAAGRRDAGLHWDYYSIDFWHDPMGDLKTPHAGRFPNGFTNILAELEALGTHPGLWLDSGQLGQWTIAENPALAAARVAPQSLKLCRATEPANRFYIEGYAHQLRANGIRLVKFDNALFNCENPAHEHLPGNYSAEPIQNAIIEFLRALDRECPDVFIMLYWNYRSPWWLEYADTIYDIGMRMEGASFATFPALRARDSVIRRLDQGRWMVKDLPALGWDTLGVWLSDWPWNSRIGKEAWQDAVVMDLCRGHLLAQLWSDTAYLSAAERRQMADFIALLKARPDCFRNPRFLFGNPWKNEPYGYCCTDGQRAFIAINNGVWRDNRFTLQLNSAWGLPDGRRWKLYRHWPEPAQLGGKLGPKTSITLRPFEIVLLEVVPINEPPTLNRPFAPRPLPKKPTEPAQPVSLAVEPADGSEQTARPNPTRAFVLRGTVPATRAGGVLALSIEFRQAGQPFWTFHGESAFSVAGTVSGRPATFQPAVRRKASYPCPWQTWRTPVGPSAAAQSVELRIQSTLPVFVEHRFSAHFIPLRLR
jgi:hypothetical protein